MSRRYQWTLILSLGMWGLSLSMWGAADALGVDVLYNFEGTAPFADKIAGDGSQNGTPAGNVSIQTAPGIVPFGLQSALFDPPGPVDPVAPPYSTIEIPGTTLGTDFSLTLAAFVDNREDPLNFTRLFSSYRGTGPVTDNRILLDYDPTGGVIPGIRAIVNNTVVGTTSVPAGLADPGYHHFALTIDAGDVTVYVDGNEVVRGNVGLGYSNSLNLFVGEDPHDGGGSANEQLIGNVDEVLVVDQVLTPTEIAMLAGGASAQSVVTPTGSLAVNYDFEGDVGSTFVDKFAADGMQNGIGTFNAIAENSNAAVGSGSAALDDPRVGMPPAEPFSLIKTGISGTDLGSAFTISAVVNVPGGGFANGGLTRLFSTFAGSGSAAGSFLFDFNPLAADGGLGMRMILPDGTNLTLPNTFSLNEDHTLTATYDNGLLTLYLDGSEIGSTLGDGGVVDLGEFLLQIGEDLGGGVNENFVGTMDDVLIRGRAFSADEVALLHRIGATPFVPEPTTAGIVMLLGGCLIARRRAR